LSFVTTARALLRTVDGLSYHDRQRLLADHGRRLGGAELLGLLDELHGQGEFARRIAMTMAGIAGERRYVERCLSGVETSVLTHALKLTVRLSVPVDVLVARLPSLPTALRVVLYQEVRRDGATTLAEALLPVARARFGDREAAQLLPVCQPETIAALLPELDYAVTGWRRIAHWYPHVFLDHLDAALAATPRSGWGRLLGTVGGGLTTAALAAPDRVLDVLERAVPHAPLPAALGRVLGALGRHNAPRLLGVLLHPRRTGLLPGGRKLWQALLDTNAAELAVLGRSLPESRRSRFLRTAPPGQRAAVYAGMVGGRTPAEAGLPMTVLDLLPAESRFAEARRLLGLRTVTDDPAVRLEVTARLPWTEAREPLRVATRRASAQERAAAYMCLIAAGAASRDPEVFADMLGLPSQLAAALAPALAATKVTARKQAVRLLALHHAEGAVETVMSEWSNPDQHRDVRRALVFASLHLLDDERVWPLLADAVDREHEVATAVLGVGPHFIAERHRPRYASLVRTVAAAGDADTARVGLAALSAWIRWCPEGMDLLTDRVTDLTSTATWLPALGTLVNACATIVDPTPLRTVTTHLAATDVTVDDRDLPARQRLLALAKLVCDAAVTSPVLRHAATELAVTLANAPTLRRPAIELAIAAVPLEAGAEDVDALLRVVQLADTPVWAWHAHDTLRTTLTWRGRAARIPQSHLHDLATVLAARTGPAAPFLALAIATSAGERTGWPPRWRELIYALRRHPDTDVSLAALDTFTVAE
jgi:hypothetical protein